MADSETAAAKDIDEGNQVCKRAGAGANSSALMANGSPCFWNILNPHAWFNPERLNPRGKRTSEEIFFPFSV
ncbi:hypothetical protein EAI_14952 [Harpegnathos saltator]|uniref:Uncharacterized protein n=1 Tax=Harpegnathos saltator TaxID=610380 RepID=E2BWP5_HARSA|nr:hypothetical protein EAI_14952 [Harpegnathos saltator]